MGAVGLSTPHIDHIRRAAEFALDLRRAAAQIGAVLTAEKRILELCEKYGTETIENLCIDPPPLREKRQGIFIYQNIQIPSPCLYYRNIRITENGEFIFIIK